MNIQIVRSGRLSFDVNLYKSGTVTFTSAFVKKFNLEGKNVVAAIDTDDKENRFIYFTVDTTGRDTNGFLVKKSKGGSYQFNVSAMGKQLKEKSAKYVFHNQVHQGAKGFIQLVKVDEETSESVTQKKTGRGKKETADA